MSVNYFLTLLENEILTRCPLVSLLAWKMVTLDVCFLSPSIWNVLLLNMNLECTPSLPAAGWLHAETGPSQALSSIPLNSPLPPSQCQSRRLAACTRVTQQQSGWSCSQLAMGPWEGRASLQCLLCPVAMYECLPGPPSSHCSVDVCGIHPNSANGPKNPFPAW